MRFCVPAMLVYKNRFFYCIGILFSLTVHVCFFAGESDTREEDDVLVQQSDFVEALAHMVPSVSSTDFSLYQSMKLKKPSWRVHALNLESVDASLKQPNLMMALSLKMVILTEDTAFCFIIFMLWSTERLTQVPSSTKLPMPRSFSPAISTRPMPQRQRRKSSRLHGVISLCSDFTTTCPGYTTDKHAYCNMFPGNFILLWLGSQAEILSDWNAAEKRLDFARTQSLDYLTMLYLFIYYFQTFFSEVHGTSQHDWLCSVYFFPLPAT